MGACSTKIKLSDDDKKVLELSIDDKMNFTSNLLLCKSKTTSKKDIIYLNQIAFRHLEKEYSKK
jgi:hypothetical protein